MLKGTLLSAILITASVASPLIYRQGVGVVTTSPTASQEVSSAITSFSDDVNTVSTALMALKSETDANTITAIATNGLSAESDEDNQRQVLFRFAGDAGTDSNQLITTFTPDVLNGFQAIINNPSPGTAQDQAQQISLIRNTNILPSITGLANAALAGVGEGPSAPSFTPT
ncbi:hypothetical protein LARI1_G009546 [Lachnellula arida]|uniref:Uncharacterized protein n=1 Tax=Lachnellula arida TaxID=1316785 RepID=A0A8T9B2D3_9HELO|nr:hypothetical protein LARI1_G009546 [Lachnellula arida]